MASTLNGYPADANPLNWVQYLNQMLTALQLSEPLDALPIEEVNRRSGGQMNRKL